MNDYFQGAKADEPHPCFAATGSEGRCELCGLGPDAPLHEAWLAEHGDDEYEPEP